MLDKSRFIVSNFEDFFGLDTFPFFSRYSLLNTNVSFDMSITKASSIFDSLDINFWHLAKSLFKLTE